MQRATRRVRFLRGGNQSELLPTVRYVIRYAVREVGPNQLPPHLQGLPIEPAWALVKETTEVLPEGQRRLWVQELQPSQLQRALRSQPVFHADLSPLPAAPAAAPAAAAAAAAGSSSRRNRAQQHESGRPVYRGAAALERAVEKARESAEQAAAAVRQAESAAAAAASACIVATATAGVAAGAAAAAKARVTNMPPYTFNDSSNRVPSA
ncbi:hypothetical protein Emed_003963 [Eimeria media]